MPQPAPGPNHRPPPGWRPGKYTFDAFTVNVGHVPPGVRIGFIFSRPVSSIQKSAALHQTFRVTREWLRVVLLTSKGGCFAGPDGRKPLTLGIGSIQPIGHQ